jgi:hypothetical protein
MPSLRLYNTGEYRTCQQVDMWQCGAVAVFKNKGK